MPLYQFVLFDRDGAIADHLERDCANDAEASKYAETLERSYEIRIWFHNQIVLFMPPKPPSDILSFVSRLSPLRRK